MLNFSGEVTGSYPEELSSILRAWTIWGYSVNGLAQRTFNPPGQGSNPCAPTIYINIFDGEGAAKGCGNYFGLLAEAKS
jgi:hypothetical protein